MGATGCDEKNDPCVYKRETRVMSGKHRDFCSYLKYIKKNFIISFSGRY